MDSWDMNLSDYIEKNEYGLLHDFIPLKKFF